MESITALMGVFAEIIITGTVIAVILLVVRALAVKSVPRKYMCFLWLILVFRLLCPFVPQRPVKLDFYDKIVGNMGFLSDTDTELYNADNNGWQYTVIHTDKANEYDNVQVESGNNSELAGENKGQMDSVAQTAADLLIQTGTATDMVTGITTEENVILSSGQLTASNNTLATNQQPASDSLSIVGDIGTAISDDKTINQSRWNTLGLKIFAAVWLAGFIVMLSYFAVGYRDSRKRIFAAVLTDTVEVNTLFRKKLRIPVYESQNIESPMVTGIFTPEIYLPTGFKTMVSENEYSCIMKHELAHIVRGDVSAKLLSLVVLCIHWFNPLVWAAMICFQKDIEMACDEYVITHTKEDVKRDYANALLQCAMRKSGISIMTAFGESNTEKRVSNILKYKKPTVIITTAAVIAVAGAFIFLGLKPGTVNANTQDNPGIAGTDNADNNNIGNEAGIDNNGLGNGNLADLSGNSDSSSDNDLNNQNQPDGISTGTGSSKDIAISVGNSDNMNNNFDIEQKGYSESELKKIIEDTPQTQIRYIEEHLIKSCSVTGVSYTADEKYVDSEFILSNGEAVRGRTYITENDKLPQVGENFEMGIERDYTPHELILYSDFGTGVAAELLYVVYARWTNEDTNITYSSLENNIRIYAEVAYLDDRIIPTGNLILEYGQQNPEKKLVATEYLNRIPYSNTYDFDGDGKVDPVYYTHDENAKKCYFVESSLLEAEVAIGDEKGTYSHLEIEGADLDGDGVAEICQSYFFMGADHSSYSLKCFSFKGGELKEFELPMAGKETTFDYARDRTDLKIYNREYGFEYEMWDRLIVYDSYYRLYQGEYSEITEPSSVYLGEYNGIPVVNYEFNIVYWNCAAHAVVAVSYIDGEEKIEGAYYKGYINEYQQLMLDKGVSGVQLEYEISAEELEKSPIRDILEEEIEQEAVLYRIHEIAKEEGIDFAYRADAYKNLYHKNEYSISLYKYNEADREALNRVIDRIREEYDGIIIDYL